MSAWLLVLLVLLVPVCLGLGFGFGLSLGRARLHSELADLNQLVADMLNADDRDEQLRLARSSLVRRGKVLAGPSTWRPPAEQARLDGRGR